MTKHRGKVSAPAEEKSREQPPMLHHGKAELASTTTGQRTRDTLDIRYATDPGQENLAAGPEPPNTAPLRYAGTTRITKMRTMSTATIIQYSRPWRDGPYPRSKDERGGTTSGCTTTITTASNRPGVLRRRYSTAATGGEPPPLHLAVSRGENPGVAAGSAT